MEDEKREEKIKYLKENGFQYLFNNDVFKSKFAVMSLEYMDDHKLDEVKIGVIDSKDVFDKTKGFSVFCNDKILAKIVEYIVNLQRKK